MDEKRKLLNAQIAWARERSPFYSYLPAKPLDSLEELKKLPLLSAEDLPRTVCVSPGEIRRVVTLSTSGTTAKRKRVCFTENDLRFTVEFFRDGMHTLCGSGDAVGIFMPGASPDGLCDLLSRALRAFGAEPLAYGAIRDYDDAAGFCREERPAVLVGFPGQMRRLSLLHPELRPGRVLLSADYCAGAAIETIARRWACEVYVHYGMTESGYGCAVETPARRGMLPREDMLLEALPDGELVLTTLRREAMPLIRYRTGDLGELSEDGRLLRALGRKSEAAKPVPVMALDEILFASDRVLDYEAAFSDGRLLIRVMGNTAGLPAMIRGFPANYETVDTIPFGGKRQVTML